jgi:hypothetical protein
LGRGNTEKEEGRKGCWRVNIIEIYKNCLKRGSKKGVTNNRGGEFDQSALCIDGTITMKPFVQLIYANKKEILQVFPIRLINYSYTLSVFFCMEYLQVFTFS